MIHTQLYMWIKVTEAHNRVKLDSYLRDIKTWMTPNFLMLNTSKKEIIAGSVTFDQFLTYNSLTLTFSRVWVCSRCVHPKCHCC